MSWSGRQEHVGTKDPCMRKKACLPRRQFLKQGIAALGATLAAPRIVAAAVRGKDGKER